MKHIRNLVILLAAMHLTAFANPHDEFVGTWSHEWTDGEIHLVIEQDGPDAFLVKAVQSQTGEKVFTGKGKVVDNQLVFSDGHGGLLKLAYSSAEDGLLLVDKPNYPVYRRVNTAETALRDSIKQEIDQLVRPVMGGAGMACSGRKPQAGELSNASLGLPAGSTISGTYVQAVFIDGTTAEPRVTVTLGFSAAAKMGGRSMIYKGKCSAMGVQWWTSVSQ